MQFWDGDDDADADANENQKQIFFNRHQSLL